MTNRMKIYDAPHKALRNALSQLSLLAGKTNYSNPQEIEILRDLGMDVFKILNIHAADENEVTLAELEIRCPGCSRHDVEDHEKIHVVQDKLEKSLSNIYSRSKSGSDVENEGAEFYLAFSEFHSIYLEHTAEEERVTQPLLWQHFTDEELMSHRGRIMSKMLPQFLLLWIRFIIPAQNPGERVGLLSGFKKMAPPAFFQEVMEVIKKVLTETEYKSLQQTLG